MKKTTVQRIRKAAIILLAVAQTVISSAHSSDQHGHASGHSHGHLHGQGFMTVIFDEGQLAIEMRSPAADILGFEHAPNTPEQHTLLTNAHQLLQTPHSLITLSPTCTLIDSNITLPFTPKQHTPSAHHDHKHNQHQHDSSHSHGHKTEHKQDKHQSKHQEEHKNQQIEQHHEHKHQPANHPEPHQQPEQTHTDITAHYTWQCKNTTPPSIALAYFTHYPAFTRITAQWIINGKQGAMVLTPNNATLRF